MFLYTFRMPHETPRQVFDAMGKLNPRIFWTMEEMDKVIPPEAFPIVLNGAEMMSAEEMEAAK